MPPSHIHTQEPAFTSAPIDMTILLPLARSLGSNSLTNYGKDMSGLLKLAEVLPQTKIESLECATAQVFAFVSAPVDTPALSLFSSYPSLAVSQTTASETRASLHSLPSSRRHKSPTSSAPPPPSVRFYVSAH